MNHNYEVIQLEEWDRAHTFKFYQDFQNPFYNLIADVDITDAIHYARRNQIPVFLAYYHAAITAVNDIPQLKVRMVNGELRKYEEIHMGSTFLNKDESFSFCAYAFHREIDVFVHEALKVIDMMRNSKVPIEHDPRQNLVYSTTVPWVRFTSLQHPYKHNPEDLIPRLSFGKFYQDGDRIKIPFSAHIHHGIADGIHVGRLFEKFEKNCLKYSLTFSASGVEDSNC